VLSQAERFARYGADERVPERMRRALAQRAALPFPLDFRIVDPVDKVAPQARPARQLAWMRAPEPLGDDPALHRCVVAYGSDFALLETALLPHAAAVPSSKLTAASIGASAALRQLWLLWQRSRTDESLDHAMWFHRPFRADEWLLYEIESPAASGASLTDLLLLSCIAHSVSSRQVGAGCRLGGCSTRRGSWWPLSRKRG
jgi:acyl-CoA thioesterase-2